ncbi:hypothetical protein HYQ46_008375 [Verticillium longisporum]|nr:hypothetical protein HYQ46_008375 [Verticillium longisporum]
MNDGGVVRWRKWQKKKVEESRRAGKVWWSGPCKGKVELANVFDAGGGRSCRAQCASTFLGTIDLDQTREVGERAEQVL